MSKRFIPVLDPERARFEQNEEQLRKHRQFDTPFTLLPEDLTDPKKPKRDFDPLSKPSNELCLDKDKLWRKKTELFERKKLWGRETFEYSNPEETRSEGSNADRKRRPGDAAWDVRGHRGGRTEDVGHFVHQRGEVDQKMIKNEKGLWVRKQVVANEDEEDASTNVALCDGEWVCPKCRHVNPKKAMHLCEECGMDRTIYEQYKARPGEDPRMEAAKPKRRSTTDAQSLALQALTDRRQKARESQMMSTSRSSSCGSFGKSEKYVPLNSSAQQVRSCKRSRKFDQWQGVQRTDEEAAHVAGRALGSSHIGKDALEAAKFVRA